MTCPRSCLTIKPSSTIFFMELSTEVLLNEGHFNHVSLRKLFKFTFYIPKYIPVHNFILKQITIYLRTVEPNLIFYAWVHFSFCNFIIWTDFTNKEWRVDIMLTYVCAHRFCTVVCIAVSATIFASIICANIQTFNTTTLQPLVFIFPHFQRAI